MKTLAGWAGVTSCLGDCSFALALARHKQLTRQAKEIADALLPNLRALSARIARKPPQFDPRWARSISESFTLYTRTSTVNLLVALGDLLREYHWPFPAFIDLEEELHGFGGEMRSVRHRLLRALLGEGPLTIAIMEIATSRSDERTQHQLIDALLCRRFKKASPQIFSFWSQHPILVSRAALLNDIGVAYERKLWGVCVPAVLPILDFVVRHYLRTDDLRTSVGTVAEAFRLGGMTYEALKPGFGVWEAAKTDSGVKPISTDVEHDLRLPGLYLASFIDCAQELYSWHATGDDGEAKAINRHAALHGDVQYWSETDTVKVLTFLDQSIKLEPVLAIVLGNAEYGAC